MNYANMIEEKNLKKTFIIATLVSTLVGTFSSSQNLYERLRDKRKQEKKDNDQNDEIKKLKEELGQMRKQGESRSRKGSPERLPRESRSRKGSPGRPPRDEFLDSLANSGALIRREYDDGFARLGQRYAGGDLVTENQLQAQVIALQQTVINVLQDALYNDRQISRADVHKLVTASEAARDGSLDALRHQFQRMATSAPSERRLSLPAKSAPALIKAAPSRSATPPMSTSRALGPPRRAETDLAPPLFCRYGLDLQYVPRKPLGPAFTAGRGDGRCPACDIRISVDSQDLWKISKHTPVLVTSSRQRTEEVLEERTFDVGARFVVKSHTEDGGYACVLCNRNRDVDVICPTPEALVAHVGREHDAHEYERESDLVEVW